MSGADEVLVAFERPRRDGRPIVKTWHFSNDDAFMHTTPLEQLTTRRRKTHADISFSSLGIRYKKGMYHLVATLLQINESLPAIDAACIVEANFGVSIDPSDRHLIGIYIRNRVKAKHQLRAILI